MDLETVYEEHGYGTDGAVAALMHKWGTEDEEDGGSPSESEQAPAEGAQEEPSEKEEESQEERDASEEGEADDPAEEAADGEEDSAEGDEGQEEGNAPVADDAKVTVEVNGESKEFSVADLKRLAGQEAALTQKSQEVATARKRYEEGQQAQRTALEAMVARAQKRFEPYKDFDFALAAAQYDPETYKALKEDAQAAHADLAFFQGELQQLVGRQQQEYQQELQRRAQAAVAELRDPQKGIPGFNREMLTAMQDYAARSGIEQAVLEQMVDPAAWRLVHKAMEYDKLATAKQKAKPTAAKVRRPVKTGKTQSGAKAGQERGSRADLQRIATTSGIDSVEAAADALMKRWASHA
ncbi:MAG: hypothetical protein J7D61_07795 [Marichromatium sp.]|nr:hypothetical protein [Marichromatium sp.]